MLSSSRTCARAPEEIRPHDVAGPKPLHLGREQLSDLGGVGCVDRVLEDGSKTLETDHAKPKRIDSALVRLVERPRRVQVLRVLHLRLGDLDEARELRVELLLLQADCRQRRRELLAESRGGCSDRSDVRHVARVPIALAIGRAALDPDREQDNHENGEPDEGDEPKERRQVARRLQPSPRRPRATTARRAGSSLVRVVPRRRLLLVEEVEIEDVFVALCSQCAVFRPETVVEWQERQRSFAFRPVSGSSLTPLDREEFGEERITKPQRCPRSRTSSRPESSSSSAIAPCARWEAAATDPCGSRATSKPAWTSR